MSIGKRCWQGIPQTVAHPSDYLLVSFFLSVPWPEPHHQNLTTIALIEVFVVFVVLVCVDE